MTVNVCFIWTLIENSERTWKIHQQNPAKVVRNRYILNMVAVVWPNNTVVYIPAGNTLIILTSSRWRIMGMLTMATTWQQTSTMVNYVWLYGGHKLMYYWSNQPWVLATMDVVAWIKEIPALMDGITNPEPETVGNADSTEWNFGLFQNSLGSNLGSRLLKNR